MLGNKKKRKGLPCFSFARQFWLYEGEPVDNSQNNGGGVTTDDKTPEDKNKPDDKKTTETPAGTDDKKTELPADVQERLKRLEQLENQKAEDERKAQEKAEEERKAKLTADQREAERDAEIKKMRRDNTIYKVRERLGMVGGIYADIDPLVRGEDEDAIEKSLKALKEKFDGHIEDRAKELAGKKGTGGDTPTKDTGKPNGGDESKPKLGKMPTGLASQYFSADLKGAN